MAWSDPLGGLSGVGGRHFFFQNMVMLHIKLKGMKTSTTCKQYFSLGLGQKAKGQTIFFSASWHVRCIIKL